MLQWWNVIQNLDLLDDEIPFFFTHNQTTTIHTNTSEGQYIYIYLFHLLRPIHHPRCPLLMGHGSLPQHKDTKWNTHTAVMTWGLMRGGSLTAQDAGIWQQRLETEVGGWGGGRGRPIRGRERSCCLGGHRRGREFMVSSLSSEVEVVTLATSWFCTNTISFSLSVFLCLMNSYF